MRKIFVMMAIAASLASMASCDMLEDVVLPDGAVNELGDQPPAAKTTPSKVAENGFEQQIPEGTDIWDVEWDFEGTHWEVEYKTGPRPHGVEYTMYFDLDGNWLATKTEILLRDVPQNIIDAVKASEYGTSYIDDEEADYFQTASGDFYRFEIEIKGRDAEIDVDMNGNVTFVRYDN